MWSQLNSWCGDKNGKGGQLLLGEVAAPHAALIRPDGYVAWVGDGTPQGLTEALTSWFGKPGHI